MGIVNHHGLPVVTGQPWPGVRYFTTTRHRDAAALPSAARRSTTPMTPYDYFNLADHVGDDDKAVQMQRERLADALPSKPIWLEQVHGTDVVDADVYRTHNGSHEPIADAAVTTRTDRVLCIMTADCLPVVIASECARVLGIAHAGWRGLAAGVLENMFALMQKKIDAQGISWRAWIGPAIGQDAFEVGDEVRAAFVEHHTAAAECFRQGVRPGKWQADLTGLAERRLKQLGVALIETAGMCTYSSPHALYSYRRDGQTGRMASVAWLGASDLP